MNHPWPLIISGAFPLTSGLGKISVHAKSHLNRNSSPFKEETELEMAISIFPLEKKKKICKMNSLFPLCAFFPFICSSNQLSLVS